MTEEIFESEFHKKYVGGEGRVEEKVFWLSLCRREVTPITVEEILTIYRSYVHDPEAKLPPAIIDELKLLGKELPSNE